ncbi:NnrS family protein [Thalassobaculum sp.]|uniref:NnrS family protein n=1 Tax=Thalassobaculum sp. TaxID=2022740 RepID=UPI0032F05744
MSATSAIRPDRAAPGLPVLEVGFRPFFLAGAVWAVLVLAIWLAALSGLVDPGGSSYGALAWHAHEMVFGVGSAIVGGFLLTAMPGWTGQPKLAGRGLALLVGLWALGRVLMLVPDLPGVAVVAAVDLGFLAVLSGRGFLQVRAGRNWRNLPVAAGPLLMLAGNALVHAEAAGLASRGAELGAKAGLAVIVLLIAMIGGRIIPAFTRNWLNNTGRGGPLPSEPDRVDGLVLAATVLALTAWLAAPEAMATGILAAVAAAGGAVRLARWCGWRTLAEPLVWVLHLGFLWVPVGLALAAGAALMPELVPAAAVPHAFGVGAMGTMTLAMMTRATLGHTGRALVADRVTTAIYLLVTAAAVCRVLAALAPALAGHAVELSGGAWMLAFGLYAVAYAPKLWGRKVDAAG